jgi:hypothetical protein
VSVRRELHRGEAAVFGFCPAKQYHYHQPGCESRGGQGLFSPDTEGVDAGRIDHS